MPSPAQTSHTPSCPEDELARAVSDLSHAIVQTCDAATEEPFVKLSALLSAVAWGLARSTEPGNRTEAFHRAMAFLGGEFREACDEADRRPRRPASRRHYN
jgi:hypothetical protein